MKKDKVAIVSKPQNYFYIIGIGTSAGGLKALKSFFEYCPDNTGLAYVVVQHLAPDYKSLMPELLSKTTKMKVAEANDQDVVKPNNIYLIPRGKNITIVKGKLILIDRPSSNQMNFSIDIFFESLAKDRAHLAIGVILSGTGSDGTKGAKAIKEVGGSVIAQSPETSSFDGMPRSVITHNLADYILAPKDMASEIVQYVKNPQFNFLVSGTDLSHEMDSINQILNVVNQNTTIDFSGYKMPTILRRTAKRLNIQKCESIEEYLDLIYNDSVEAKALAREYLISVTNFFRNPKVFDFLHNIIFPEMIKNALEKKQDLKLWVVACATGEEVFSLAIIIEECIRNLQANLHYKIYATDVDEVALSVASKGIYSKIEVKGIKEQYLERYFQKHNDSYKVNQDIRGKIIFSKHNIVVNPPFNNMDFVSCRNMLIYLDVGYKSKAMNAMKYALKTDGYLLLGKSETPGVYDKSFRKINNTYRIYQNINNYSFSGKDLSNWIIDNGTTIRTTSKKKILSIEEMVTNKFQSTILDHYKSASVCVDENLTIIHALGKFKRYLTIPEDGFSNNLSRIISDDILIPIQSSVRIINKNKENKHEKEIRVKLDKRNILLKIQVEKLSDSEEVEGIYLITFLELSELQIIEGSHVENKSGAEEIGLLKDTLKETKENLQLTIEEIETSNEEMQATNEELLAANEELQSTNEELQSVNEELHTVNAELQSKNLLLLELNTDIENLFQNIQVGTLFLDKENRIRKYTNQIQKHYGFREEDIGRSIGLYSGTIMGSELIEIAEKVKETGKKSQSEIQHSDGTWFWVEVFPYIGIYKDTSGVTVNFINIDQLKRSTTELNRTYTFLNEFTNATPTLASILNLETKKIEYVTGDMQTFYGVSRDEILDNDFDIAELILEEDRKLLVKHIEQLKNQKTKNNVITKLRFRNQKTQVVQWMMLNSTVYQKNSKGKAIKSINVLQNITPLVQIENELSASEERYRLALSTQKVGLWECKDIGDGNTWWSEEYKNLLAYPESEYAKGYDHFLSIIDAKGYDTFIKELKISFESGKAFSTLLQLKVYEGSYRWYEVNCIAERNIETKKDRVICSVADVHEKVLYQKIIESKQKLLDNIYENTPAGFVILDEKAIIKDCSSGFVKMGKWNKSTDLINKSFVKLWHEKNREILEREYRRLGNFEIPFIVREKELLTSDNSSKICSIHIARIESISKTGKLENIFCAIISDLSKDVNSDKTIQKFKNQLALLYNNFSKNISSDLEDINSNIKAIEENINDTKLISELTSVSKSLKHFYSEIGGFYNNINEIESTDGLTQINLNKLFKKLNKSFSKDNISIEYDFLPGIIAVENQIIQLITEIIETLYLIVEQKPDMIVMVNSKKVENQWQINLETSYDKLYIDQKKIHNILNGLDIQSDYQDFRLKIKSILRLVKNQPSTIIVLDKASENNIGFGIHIKDQTIFN
jgi:two-component system CheB/CheR fusion protein